MTVAALSEGVVKGVASHSIRVGAYGEACGDPVAEPAIPKRSARPLFHLLFLLRVASRFCCRDDRGVILAKKDVGRVSVKSARLGSYIIYYLFERVGFITGVIGVVIAAHIVILLSSIE